MAEALKFGTSGLRGLVSALDDNACQLYTRAFLEHLRGSGRVDTVLVGRDLRPSSPAIARSCMAAIAATGARPVDCGVLPTPALALAALAEHAPAIMVTGSHIPADRNGLKFFRKDGEIDKADEAAILGRRDALAGSLPAPAAAAAAGDALARYHSRYLAVAAAWPLDGITVGIYQHSSVARDLLTEVLAGLGATCLPFGRSDSFVPVDTEALRPEDIALARHWAAENKVDAIVSTDGDADRPLLADRRGAFLRGDTVGLLTAQMLGADTVVTPVTSSSAIERSSLFSRTVRTRVGSPYVIEGMVQAAASDGAVVVGFEANGGVLLGSSARLGGGVMLEPLPTRDAMLPILAVLAMARRDGVGLPGLVARLPERHTRSDRLEHVDPAASAGLLRRLDDPRFFAERFGPSFGAVQSMDLTDGVRLTLAGGDVLHFRASGNAPELRCYVEAGEAPRAEQTLAAALRVAAACLDR